MTYLYRRLFRAAIAPTLFGIGFAVLGSVAPAQNPSDLLNKAKNDQSILTQRLEGKMREAIGEARRLQPTSQVRAINVLKAALNQLDDPLVPTSFRTAWTAQIQTQIRSIETGKNVAAPIEINPVKREIKEADIKRAVAIQAEYYEVRRSVDTISALVKSGSTAQAQKEAEALVKRFPDNPAAIVLGENLGMNQRIADARQVVAQQEQGFLLAMRSVDKSATMPKDDIEFDAARFREISKLRTKSTLTKKEQKIIDALDSPINLGYKDAPFSEVIKAIATSTGLNILLDKNALQETMIDSNTPVSIDGRGISARSALRKILQDHGLTFIIKDESIQVVTLVQARTMLVTRVYYMGDLVKNNGPFGGAVTWGPWVDQMQTQENVARIIEAVRTIDPQSWKEQGGNGSVTFHWPSLSLVVRQTAEVHARMSGAFGK